MDDHFQPGGRNNPYTQQLFYSIPHQYLKLRMG
ncbi:Uncharacterised protein [Raoultella terrigena]|jgi:hypothetical protein|uniref:Uncharacterized protein n=1 Tax=Raoultella terrigena TaxID=577 RepID=A0A485BNU2_RAOTE|nr:Uncharacterised protein [Raoultella terrigena]